MGEGHLAGADGCAAAEERGVGDRAVRGPHRARGDQRAAVEEPGDALDRGHLDRFVEVERREDRGEAAREHRLAGSRRTDEENVVTARGGDLEGPLRRLLPTNVGEVAGGERGGGEESCRVDGGGLSRRFAP